MKQDDRMYDFIALLAWFDSDVEKAANYCKRYINLKDKAAELQKAREEFECKVKEIMERP